MLVARPDEFQTFLKGEKHELLAGEEVVAKVAGREHSPVMLERAGAWMIRIRNAAAAFLLASSLPAHI